MGATDLTALADRGIYGGEEIQACTEAGIVRMDLPLIRMSQHSVVAERCDAFSQRLDAAKGLTLGREIDACSRQRPVAHCVAFRDDAQLGGLWAK